MSARNFLVTDDQTIVLCDFSGSIIGDKKNLVRPEARYEKMGEVPLKKSLSRRTFCYREFYLRDYYRLASILRA